MKKNSKRACFALSPDVAEIVKKMRVCKTNCDDNQRAISGNGHCALESKGRVPGVDLRACFAVSPDVAKIVKKTRVCKTNCDDNQRAISGNGHCALESKRRVPGVITTYLM